jgi:hypothetical protein
MKTINILGDSQREQWHGVVNMLRHLGGDMPRESRSELCDELDRYIDAMEDANEENSKPQKVYALVCYEYVEQQSGSEVALYETEEAARNEMRKQYEEIIALWKHDVSVTQADYFCEFSDRAAIITEYFDDIFWRIEEKEVKA